MRLKDSTYNFLKWFVLIAVPATATFWLTIGKVWDFPYLTEIGATITAVGLFIGALIGVSTVSYNKVMYTPSEPEDSFVEVGDDNE